MIGSWRTEVCEGAPLRYWGGVEQRLLQYATERVLIARGEGHLDEPTPADRVAIVRALGWKPKPGQWRRVGCRDPDPAWVSEEA